MSLTKLSNKENSEHVLGCTCLHFLLFCLHSLLPCKGWDYSAMSPRGPPTPWETPGWDLASVVFHCCSGFGALHNGSVGADPSDRFDINSWDLSPGLRLLITNTIYLKCQTYFLEMLRITEERKSCEQPCVWIHFAIVSFKIRRQSLCFSAALLKLVMVKNQFFVFLF